MRITTLLIVACLAFPTLALAESSFGLPISAPDFFQSIQGDYSILKAGGEAPDPNDTVGDVSADIAQTRFTFPYCIPNGACFLGVTTFAYPRTQVYRAVTPDSEIYTLVTTDIHGQNKYQWETGVNGTFFRNLQFHPMPTQTIVLEMEIKKQ